MSEESDDNDLFITQSTFRTDTQEAAEAADFLDTSFDIFGTPTQDVKTTEQLFAGRTVHYLDLSEHTSDHGTTVSHDDTKSDCNHDKEEPTIEDIGASEVGLPVDENIVPGQEPFLPLLTEDDVSTVSDDLLKAAVECVTADTNDGDRFAEPTSDATVEEHSGKGCVFS